MRHQPSLSVATLAIVLSLAALYGILAVAPSRAADADALPGMAVLSGAVQAPTPFKAAQVRLMNADKNVLFMVYTSGGRYRAVNLFPGTYEVTVRGKGLEGAAQKITLAAGARETLNFTLRETAPQGVRQGEFGFTTQRVGEITLVAYDELYPKEAGRPLLDWA